MALDVYKCIVDYRLKTDQAYEQNLSQLLCTDVSNPDSTVKIFAQFKDKDSF